MAERRPSKKQDRKVAFNLAKAQKKRNKSALKVQIKQSSKAVGDPESELDTLIRGFCMMGVRTIPRELSRYKEISLSVMNMKLHQDETFVYDTGSAEGISTCAGLSGRTLFKFPFLSERIVPSGPVILHLAFCIASFVSF